jgi:hypothetical protein
MIFDSVVCCVASIYIIYIYVLFNFVNWILERINPTIVQYKYLYRKWVIVA